MMDRAESAIRKLRRLKSDFYMTGANATTIERAIDLLRGLAESLECTTHDVLRLHNEKIDAKWPDSSLLIVQQKAEARAQALEEAAQVAKECVLELSGYEKDDPRRQFYQSGAIDASMSIEDSIRALHAPDTGNGEKTVDNGGNV